MVQEGATDAMQLLKIDEAHGSIETPVNDVKFCPKNEHHLLSVGSDGLYKIWDLRAGSAVI